MKKQFIWAVGAVALTAICVVNVEAKETDSAELPIFVQVPGYNNAILHYWSNISAPVADDPAHEDFAAIRKSWERQERFRKNPSKYTRLFPEDGPKCTVRYRGEQIVDPDGKPIEAGTIHWIEAVPNCCAYFDITDPVKKQVVDDGSLMDQWGVIVTDDYLKSHTWLPFRGEKTAPWEDGSPMPAEVVKSLERKYGMKATRSKLVSEFGDAYAYGLVQFDGEWKDAPTSQDWPDMKYCLAVDVLTDGDKIYTAERAGVWEPDGTCTWNVDDDGIYLGSAPVAAFEGNDGLSLCYCRMAPESIAVGIYYPKGDKLESRYSERYYSMIDEEMPVWNADLAKMQEMYVALDPAENKGTQFKKWAHIYVDYYNEWIWATDGEENPTGALFMRKNGELKLIAETGPNRRLTVGDNGERQYVCISGSAGGPATYTEVHTFSDGKEIERFTCLEVMGQIDESTLNGHPLTPAAAQSHLTSLPPLQAPDPLFHP